MGKDSFGRSADDEKSEASCSGIGRLRQTNKRVIDFLSSDEEEKNDMELSSDVDSDWQPEEPQIVKRQTKKRKSSSNAAEPDAKKQKKPAASKVKKPAAPKVKKPAAPKVKKPAAPKVKKPASSKIKKPASSKIKKPAAPKVENPTTPKAEILDTEIIKMEKGLHALKKVCANMVDILKQRNNQGMVHGNFDHKVESEIPSYPVHLIKQNPNSFLPVANKHEFHSTEDVKRLWKNEDLVCESTGVPKNIVRNVLTLLDQDCTVPFIARYRKDRCGCLPPEKIREIESSYESVKSIRKRVDNIVKTLNKTDVDPSVTFALLNARTPEEVEFLYAPLKPGHKRSKAERAKQLGLEECALDLLQSEKNLQDIDFCSVIDSDIPGKSTREEVLTGMRNIIADIFSKDIRVLELVRNYPRKQLYTLECKESATAIKEARRALVEGTLDKSYKYGNYFNYTQRIKDISSHQILAMNRGESQKVLTIKLHPPPQMKDDMIIQCWRLVKLRSFDTETTAYFCGCIKDAYDRLLEPLMSRQIRSELTKKASKESVDVFSQNLKRLLLTPPVRGKTVLGIDPGFKHGCKLAVVSSKGEVLKTDVMYLPKSENLVDFETEEKFVNLVKTFGVTIVAIGNGTACRQTELWLSNLIRSNAFRPNMVKYCIVDESGVSIYSVTKEAEAELPGMDPNLRSAVSIARRLQDPLLEYVKVEPKHLGVGMYQHDINDNMLKTALNGVVSDCVSFVGLDLNVCPEMLLQKIAGLSSAKAKQIIQWRKVNECFVNRQQLLEVKGLGPKSYEQCAGFVKIFPQTSVKSSNSAAPGKPMGTRRIPAKEYEANLLDTTTIHPESYDIAIKFLEILQADVSEIGQQSLVDKVKSYTSHTTPEYTADKIGATVEQMQLIIEAFNQLMDYDIRSEFDVPLFKIGVSHLSDLKTGHELTGRITNVTNFGAFVDIGVGHSGLMHVSKMRSRKVQLGDRVTVKVISIDVPKKWIGLELVLK